MKWRGRVRREEQVANARDSFVDLTPVSPVPAELIKAAWAATMPGQTIPKIGEARARQEE